MRFPHIISQFCAVWIWTWQIWIDYCFWLFANSQIPIAHHIWKGNILVPSFVDATHFIAYFAFSKQKRLFMLRRWKRIQFSLFRLCFNQFKLSFFTISVKKNFYIWKKHSIFDIFLSNLPGYDIYILSVKTNVIFYMDAEKQLVL